ncbi:MAG TPA: carbohydrate kinase family protein [Candidatus Acidoferrum sp.]|nr:carbohydrate kinase family protein [Candidatus Acidoferrum sp.]
MPGSQGNQNFTVYFRKQAFETPLKYRCHNVSVFLILPLKAPTLFVIISDVTSRIPSPRNGSLVIFGEFFFDYVFYNLPAAPRMGEEVKTKHFGVFPGGGLATTALVAAKLGTPTKVITKVGHDALSNPAWQRLKLAGVSTKDCEYDPRVRTAMTVCAAFGGDRMMVTHDVINQDLAKLLSGASVQKQIRSAKHLHLACSMLPFRNWKLKIKKLLQQGTPLSVDMGWNPEALQSSQLSSILQNFEFTFPNEIEAKAMTGERSVEAAAKKLARWVRIPVVKLGQGGSLAVRNGKIVRAKSLRIRTVDATGSGDAFNGGFLHGHLSGWPLEDCLRAGNVCGALAASSAGGSASIPGRNKLKELMNKLR